MIEAIDWGKVGAAVTAISIGVGGVYAWWLQQAKVRAVTRADVSEADAQVAQSAALSAVADAQQAVYRLMQDRLTTLEADMRGVREELAMERQHARRLVLHIWKLEGLMRAASLDVPAFVDGEAPNMNVTANKVVVNPA